jgi:predicted component of type VI protein secretion system
MEEVPEDAPPVAARGGSLGAGSVTVADLPPAGPPADAPPPPPPPPPPTAADLAAPIVAARPAAGVAPVAAAPVPAPAVVTANAGFDVTKIPSGAEVTTAMLNKISLEVSKGNMQWKQLGQGENERQVLMQDGKVIGGFNKGAHGETTSFATRSDMETHFAGAGKSLQSMEAGLSAIPVGGMTPKPVEVALAPAPRVDVGLKTGL